MPVVSNRRTAGLSPLTFVSCNSVIMPDSTISPLTNEPNSKPNAHERNSACAIKPFPENRPDHWAHRSGALRGWRSGQHSAIFCFLSVWLFILARFGAGLLWRGDDSHTDRWPVGTCY